MSNLSNLLQSYGLRTEYVPKLEAMPEPESVIDALIIAEKSLGIEPCPVIAEPEAPHE